MSKPVTTTTKQTAAAVNSNNSASPKNAWAKGPPVNPVGQSSLPSSAVASPRSQSPNPQLPPTASHSRKSSGLGPGVAIKDGVSLPRSMAVAGHRQTPSINFGSIDSPSPVAPTNGHRGSQTADGQSSLPHPPLKPFGSVPISNPTSTPSITSSPSPANVAATSPTPSVASTAASSQQSVQPKKAKLDIHKMFQVNPQSQGAPAHSSPSLAPTSLPGPILSSPAVPSPQIRSSNLPQPAAHSPYIPPQSQSSHLRAHQSQPAPRSPQMARNNLAQGPTGPQMPNRGSVITPVPQLPQSSGPAGAQLSSPRLGHQLPAHHQPPQPPPQTPQHQVPPQMHVPIHPQPWQGYYQPYYHPQDYSMSAPAAYWQQPGPPHAPYLPPHQHPHHQPPNSMPHSPRHGPMSTLPPNNGPPSAATTPINTAIANSPAPSSSRLSSTPLTPRAPEFIPSGKKQIRITNASGEAVTFRPPDSISRDEKKEARKSTPIRLESEDDRRKRVAEEEARKRAEEEEVRKVEEDKKRAVEEQLKREREAEAKRIRLEEEEKQRQEQERLKKEEEDRIKVEKERRKIEEEERLKKEEEERLVREEEERKARDAEEKRRLEEQEQERLRKEAEEARLQKEAEENAKKEAERLAEEALVKKEKERIELEERRRNDERIKDSSAMTVSPKLVAVVPSAKPALHPLNTLNGDKPRRPVPGPLDLSNTNKPGMPAPLPSALATARIIDDLDSIHYPPGIKTPDTELNQGNTKGGKFKYDRDFLLQFMSICKDKPDSLPPLDALGIEKEEGGSSNLSAYGSQGRAAGRRQAGSMGPPMSRSASLGIGNPSLSARGGLGGPMGNFSTPSAKLPSASGTSSEERFAASNAMRSASAAFVGGRPTPMVRTSSQGGIGSRDGGPASPRENQRTRSQRGRQRNDSLKPNNAAAAQAAVSSSLAHGLSNLGLEPVVPLQATENRWVPVSKVGKGAVETDSPETVDRKVKALLNKLTMEKFESISNQIIAWANKSETEKDGRTLIQVIRLVFEKATDEATWSEMYARLCRKMMEQISQNVQDDGIRNTEGNPITGGQLFRKYLLNRCQEDFERGWSMKESTAAAAAAKAHEDKAVAEDAAKKQKDGKEEEVELYSEEYYAALKAKRQGLGLVKFIGELFKLSMLTERIMHECIKKLLSNVDDPEEEEIESLCKLLTTVGQSLDTVKAKGHMDIYFSRMSELAKNEKLTSRVRYMLQDVIELRHRNWLPRSTVAVPQTRSQIQEATAKERAAQEKELARLPSMSRGGSRRGEGNRGDFNQNAADGWNVAGGGNQARPAPKAGDLSNFGKITKSGGMMNLGPSSVFKKEGKGRDTPQSLSRTASSSNMFSMLSSGAGDAPIEPPPVTGRTQSNRGSSRKSSVDMSATNTLAPDTPVRKKIQLLPRTVGVSTAPPDEKDESGQQSASEDEDEEPSSSQKPVMSEERAKAKIDEDIKEFFALKKIDEAENYFHDLPEEHRHLLVDKLVARAFDGKEAEVELVADLFSRASVTSGCSAESFEKGLFPTIEYLDDIAIDVPHAYVSMAKLLKGTSLSRSAVEVLATRIIVDGEPLVSPKDKLLKEFNKLEA